MTASPPARTVTALPRAPRLALLHGVAAAHDPEGYLRGRARRDGDPFRVALPGMGSILFTGAADGARAIFGAPPEQLEPPRPNPIEPLLGGSSLILLAGDRHRRARKLITPPLNGARMRASGQVIQDAALAELATWTAGASLDLLRSTQAITLQVIVRAIFGVDEAPRRAAYTEVIGRVLDAYGPSLLLFPGLRRSLLGVGPWASFVRRRAALDALLTEDLARRRAAGADAHDDILHELLTSRDDDGVALTDDELRDELRTLLVAGHETTATSLAWALFHIHRAPVLRARVLDELAPLGATPDPGALVALPWLGAVCHEVLRRHPVVPVVLRRLLAPMTLRGVEVPAGDTVGVAVSLLHGDPAVWPDPDRFEPARFLDRRYSPFEYAPFGGGHRRCPGAALAINEMKIVLGTILARVSLALDEREARRPLPRVVPRNITSGPSRRLRLTVTRTG